MFRRCSVFLIGTESSPFISVVKDKRYIEHRLATLGKASANNESFKPMSDEDLKRFTTSVGNKENLFNHRAGGVQPSLIVDEATGRIIGSEALNPTRYGDWEHNGRATDF